MSSTTNPITISKTKCVSSAKAEGWTADELLRHKPKVQLRGHVNQQTCVSVALEDTWGSAMESRMNDTFSVGCRVFHNCSLCLKT